MRNPDDVRFCFNFLLRKELRRKEKVSDHSMMVIELEWRREAGSRNTSKRI